MLGIGETSFLDANEVVGRKVVGAAIVEFLWPIFRTDGLVKFYYNKF